MMSILGRGVYSLTEAARLTQLRPARVRDWFRSEADGPARTSVFQGDYPTIAGERAISFLDLIEVCVAGKLRAADPPVSLQHIRSVHQKLARDTGSKHPFCMQAIYRNGGRIFTRRFGDGESGIVIEPLTDQLYINEAIMSFLQKIEYDEVTSLASLWRISEGVVVDPTRCFGKPIVEAVGITIRVLASSFEANGRDASRVADWYEIEPLHVEAAVEFERRIAA